MHERGELTPGNQEILVRLDALEQRLSRLEQDGSDDASASTAAPPASAHPAATAPASTSPGGTSATSAAPADRDAAHSPTRTPGEDPLWALTALKEQIPPPGGVVFAGSVDVGAGHLEYQWGRPTDHLLDRDWAEHAESVAALGHPLRLAILRRLIDGEHTVAQLVDELELASTGVAYHHLSALQTGGWVTSPRRGSWAIPPSRVVPLLAIVTALEKG